MKIVRQVSMLALAGTLVMWGLLGPVSAVTSADATRLRGGEWCTEHVEAATCEGCRQIGPNNSTKCLNATGTEWH